MHRHLAYLTYTARCIKEISIGSAYCALAAAKAFGEKYKSYAQERASKFVFMEMQRADSPLGIRFSDTVRRGD